MLPEEFIRTARAKGAGEFVTLVRHALRNALGPFTTIVGLRLPALFGGAVFVETIFGWPGDRANDGGRRASATTIRSSSPA